MKKILCLLLLVWVTSIAYSQEAVRLKKSLDSLNVLKESHEKSLIEIKKEYARIEKLLDEAKFNSTVGENYICTAGTNIVKDPSAYDVVAKLVKNDKVKVLNRDATHYEIAFKSYTGWVLKAALISEADYNKKRDAEILQYRKKKILDSITLVVNKEAYEKRNADIRKKYGSVNGQRIINGQIWLGMTTEMARESRGAPYDINRTVGSFGVHEQWVYSQDDYLYFEDGILTSWQD